MRDEIARDNPRRRPQIEECEARWLSTVEPLADFQIENDATQATTAATAFGNYDFTGLATVRTEFGLTGAGQTVAVIDSGIAYDHPALGGGLGTGYRVVGGWDFTEENDANPYDDRPGGSHGTHVAGIIGSTDKQSPGVATGVDLVALRVFNDSGSGYFAWIEKALQWVHTNRNAFANPITTVNLSIGAAWNSTNLPDWTTLEDEFAQLEADGIFIAVAAGNAFTTYNTAGLSYPAASPHVVPVASVDADGSLSSFSQRQERVIAAPGRSIRSTAPDYIGNLNRKTDDFATMSGTSMASPYVAGASVLIRQAMQIVGRADINQDAIYDVMRDSADWVFDTITNQSYARLNVERAIESILADDDFGDTALTAHNLGVVSQVSVGGTIGRLDDQDYFTLTAAQTGVMRVALTTQGGLHTVWRTTDSGASVADNNILSLGVVAGQQYTIGLAGSQQLGRYSLTFQVSPLAPRWEFTLQGDVTGDGQADTIHRDANTGQWSIERTDAAQKVIGAWSTHNSYHDVQLADINGDGALDIVGRDSYGDWWATANRGGKFSNVFLGHFDSSITWDNVLLGDLDGDHAADIVGRDTATGNWVAIRSSLGRTATTIANWNPANSYQSVSVVDLTGDGRADLVGRDNHGDWWTSTCTGTRYQNRYIAGWNPSINWQDVQTSDVDGDGRADIAARDTSSGNWWAITFDGVHFNSRVIAESTTRQLGLASLEQKPKSLAMAVTASEPSELSIDEASTIAIGLMVAPAASRGALPATAAFAPCDDLFAEVATNDSLRPLTVAEPLLTAMPQVGLTEDDIAELMEPGLKRPDEQTLVDLLDDLTAATDDVAAFF